jgi:ArsR family transcriptional regulator
MYRLPLADAGFDVALLQMVLHYAEEPAGVLTEAARVLRPGGALIVVDLAAHDRADVASRLAHRWQGFSDAAMRDLLVGAGFSPASQNTIAGPLIVRLWSARLPLTAQQPAAVRIAHPALSF